MKKGFKALDDGEKLLLGAMAFFGIVTLLFVFEWYPQVFMIGKNGEAIPGGIIYLLLVLSLASIMALSILVTFIGMSIVKIFKKLFDFNVMWQWLNKKTESWVSKAGVSTDPPDDTPPIISIDPLMYQFNFISESPMAKRLIDTVSVFGYLSRNEAMKIANEKFKNFWGDAQFMIASIGDESIFSFHQTPLYNHFIQKRKEIVDAAEDLRSQIRTFKMSTKLVEIGEELRMFGERLKNKKFSPEFIIMNPTYLDERRKELNVFIETVRYQKKVM